MAKMTYLSTIETVDGKTVDFERWACKRASTVQKNLLKLYTMQSVALRIYQEELKSGAVVRCYETPDGYNTGAIVWELPTSDFIK